MRSNRIDSIQLFRGLAATLVVAFHLGESAAPDSFFRFFHHGEAGVDIFFVISGFIIFYSARVRPDMTARYFVKARFWRIIPPYWAILSLYVLAAFALWLVKPDEVDLPDLWELLVSYLLLPYPAHVIIIAWTLAIELLFYGVFSLSYFRFGQRGLIVAMGLWVVASQIFLHSFTDRPEWLGYALNSAVLEFLYGIVIAIAYLNRKTPYQLPALILGGAWMLAHLFAGFSLPVSREFMVGIPAALLVYGALGITAKMPQPVLIWGEASYILYLAHLLLFAVVGSLIRIATGFDVYASDFALLLMLVGAVIASVAANYYIERPYQRWYKRTMFG